MDEPELAERGTMEHDLPPPLPEAIAALRASGLSLPGLMCGPHPVDLDTIRRLAAAASGDALVTLAWRVAAVGCRGLAAELFFVEAVLRRSEAEPERQPAKEYFCRHCGALLPPRPRGLVPAFCSPRCRWAAANTSPDADAPTPEEIAERCGQIRAEWTDTERAMRAGVPLHVECHIPAIADAWFDM